MTLPKLNTTDYTQELIQVVTCTTDGLERYTWKKTTYGTFRFDVTLPATGHHFVEGMCVFCGEKDPDYSSTIVDYGSCGTNLSWKYYADGTLVLSGSGAMHDAGATEGRHVWAKYKDNIVRVVMEEGITSIGLFAFFQFDNLTEVVIPNTVETIGTYAFSFTIHSKPFEITIPSCVKLIDSAAFYYFRGTVYFEGDAPTFDKYAFTDSVATAYYPANNATWTASVRQDYNGDITWIPYTPKDYSITWVQAYSSLGGNIAVVFQAELSKDLAEDPNAFMRFTYAGKTVEIPVSQATRSGNYHNFYCRIASINMVDDITAQMMVGDEAIGRSVTTSLEKYCSYIISTSTDAKTVKLMKAMLNYGAAAQKMMNYKTNNLANKNLDTWDKVNLPVNASGYKHSVSGSEAGIKASEALLVLGSETTIRIGFTLTGSKSIEDYTFTVDGVEVKPVYKGGMYRLEVPNIAAHRLDEYHTFTCGGITIRYCGLSYVNQVMNAYSEGIIFDMAVALYNYSQATEAFIA